MNSLIIVACFVVAILAFVGLFLALRETPAAVVSENKAATETVPEKKEESARSKDTVLLSDSEPTTQLEKPTLAALERFPHDEHMPELEEERDADEIDYAELPTIRSISAYSPDGREQSAIHEPQLQPLLEELRNLHQQMESIEQRISTLTERVEGLSGSEVEGLSGSENEKNNWRAPSSSVKIPAQ